MGFKFFLPSLLLLLSFWANAQCIVINELMINGPGPNDGQNSPFTEEWVELFNTCDVAVDIGCFVIVDGDFAITIPFGTLLQPGAFFVIGSDNAGIPVNLNWATCGCSSGSSVGIFTNSNEQLLLYDDNNALQDAVYWGTGQFPVNITTNTIGACASANFSLANPTPDFGTIATGGGQGCSIGLSCDGGSVWVEFCGPAVTGGASNGAAVASFSATPTAVCAGDCINFTSIGTVPSDAFSWTFEGANTPSSSSQNPQSICYDQAGIYDVSLTLTNSCGEQEIAITNYITVSGEVPVVTPTGPINLCEGQSVLLETTATGNLQWWLDGTAIDGATNATYSATASGEYVLNMTEANCVFSSVPVVVNVQSNLQPIVLPQSPIVICDAQPVLLEVQGTFDNYQWLLDGNAIDGATAQEWEAVISGNYSVLVSSGDCSGTSPLTSVQFETTIEISIFPAGDVTICENGSLLLQAENDLGSYQWLLEGDAINGATNSTYTATAAGNYAVQVINENGCEAVSEEVSVSVQSVNAPTIQSANDLLGFCEGGSIELFLVENFDAYAWFLDGQSLGGSAQSIVATAAGTYSVLVTLDNCSATAADVVVTEFPSPEIVVISANSIQTCESSVILEVIADDALIWSFNGAPLMNETGETFTATTSGIYFVSALNDFGCTSISESIEVEFVDQLTIEIITDETQYCEGDFAQLSVAGNFASVAWSTGQQSFSIQVNEEGDYQVTVTDNNGCIGTATVAVEFEPLPFVDAGQDTTTDCDAGVVLTGTGEGTLQWEESASLEDVNAPFTLASPSVTTTYTLIATQGNCSATDQVTVEADCASIFIPNVFTPNGDGNNDVFRIITRGVKEYRLQIFNRWGHLLFETDDPEDVWTGGKGGYYVPDGTYMWMVYALDDNNEPLLQDGQSSGHVTVLR